MACQGLIPAAVFPYTTMSLNGSPFFWNSGLVFGVLIGYVPVMNPSTVDSFQRKWGDRNGFGIILSTTA